MEALFIFLVLAIVIGFFLFKLNYKKTKVPTAKKYEIINQYKRQLKTILKTHLNDKNRQVQEKKIFLQRCNSELSRNIFFTELEAKQIIQDLAQL